MANQGLYGLLKFFRSEEYLDAFLDGTVHFSTPETYRLAKQEGVGDVDESASSTYRRTRGDEDKWEIQVKDDDGSWTSIPGVESITIRNTGHPDRWLHCWMELSIEDSDKALDRLAADLERVLNEFGRNFVFIPAALVEEFLKRLRDAAPNADLGLFKVQYSDEAHRLGPYCKRTKYSYQREVRIMLDKCDNHELEPRRIAIPQGVRDIISKNPSLRIAEEKPGGRILALTPDGTIAWGNAN